MGPGLIDVRFIARRASSSSLEEGTVVKLELDKSSKVMRGVALLELTDLLVKAGLTVRFYDPEEKNWMDQSRAYGVLKAPGSRDGSWGDPNLEEFDRDYLQSR